MLIKLPRVHGMVKAQIWVALLSEEAHKWLWASERMIFFFFFSLSERLQKTPQNPLTFNFHGGILDKSFNSELDCECYIDWV